MKSSDVTKPGFYWARVDGTWEVVSVVVWVGDVLGVERCGCEGANRAKEVDWTDFYGPLTEPGGVWLPIETAPRDGTPVDVWSDGARVADVRWMKPDRCWKDQPEKLPTWCAMEPHYDEMHWHELDAPPSHWMPIPVMPGAT